MATGQRLIDANCIPYQKSGFPKGDGFDSRLDWAFREDIDKLPTVDAAPVVHGHWDYVGDPDEDSNVQAYCSACGAGDQHATSMLGKVPYCWHCGAKMDGEV